MNAKETAKAEAVAQLREWIKPGDTVYTILRHVSRSGMSRDVSVVLMRPDGGTLHPNYSVAKACGYTLARGGFNDALKVGGCGFDAGFEVVSNLSYALYPDGFGCTGDKCPSNDHSNGDRDYTPHGFSASGCKGAAANHWHKSAGYALRQAWL
jgi:hypothetical protein